MRRRKAGQENGERREAGKSLKKLRTDRQKLGEDREKVEKIMNRLEKIGRRSEKD